MKRAFVPTYRMNLAKRVPSILAIALASFLAFPASGQVASNAEVRFHDDLLDNLVGRWDVEAVIHGQKFTLDREAEWVLNHQYLRITEKSREDVPWLKMPFERTLYIGFNHRSKRYVVYELSVHGADVPFVPEGFFYGVRKGNELEIERMNGPEVVARSRLTWDPATGSWSTQARRIVAGKEQAPHVEQKAVPAKVSTKPGSR